MTQGYFEVSRFHGFPVVIFDSHWFAHKIQEAEGEQYMCHEILIAATELNRNKGIHLDLDINSYAAMMPYRDFMARQRSNNWTLDGIEILEDLFLISYDVRFRTRSAEKMLASPPIRYCVPLHSAPTIRHKYK